MVVQELRQQLYRVSPSYLEAHLLAAFLPQSLIKICKRHVNQLQVHAALTQILLQSLLEGEERAVQELRQQLQAERAQATQLTSDVQQHTDGAAVARALAQHSLAGQASTAMCSWWNMAAAAVEWMLVQGSHRLGCQRMGLCDGLFCLHFLHTAPQQFPCCVSSFAVAGRT